MPRLALSTRFILLALVVATLLAMAPPAIAAQGDVSGQTLRSNAFPVGTITIDAKFKYVGMREFVLYGVADCEIHVFAEIDNNVVRRYYWIQFEGYLPTRPFSHYDYRDDPERVMIGGHPFHERTWFSNSEARRKNLRPGSDSEAVLKMFDDKGYRLGADMASMRLVRLNEDKRRELMIIYSENLAPTGLTAADVNDGGKAAGRRDTLVNGLRERAVAGLTMEMK